MISLVCTKCGTTLSVDDGFAGGVCRCSKCGTIQTVPARGQLQAGGQAIFERRGPRSGATRKDLETLGEVVTSSGMYNSGLAGSGLTGEPRRRPDAQGSRSPQVVTIAAGAIAALVLVAIVAWLSFGRGGEQVAATAEDAGSGESAAEPTRSTLAAPVARIEGPSFGPIALDGVGPVVYLVDRGDATRAYTAALRRAVRRSAASLGPTRKFLVRYWTADGESPAFPATPGDATGPTLAKLDPWMNDVAGGRATDASESIARAIDGLGVAGGEIVILTGKAWQLDDAFARDAIAKLVGKAKLRVHAVALGGSAGSDALRRVATKASGKYVEMELGALEQLGK